MPCHDTKDNAGLYRFLPGSKTITRIVLTIKILFTINSLEKKKQLFIQNTTYNSYRFKKHLI